MTNNGGCVMFCSKCGNEINDSDRFCPNCGEKIIKNHNNYIDDEVYRNIKLLNNKHHNRRKKKNNKKIVIGSSIASGLIIIVILCLTVGMNIPRWAYLQSAIGYR